MSSHSMFVMRRRYKKKETNSPIPIDGKIKKWISLLESFQPRIYLGENLYGQRKKLKQRKKREPKHFKSIYHWIPFHGIEVKNLCSRLILCLLSFNESLAWHFWYVDDEKIASKPCHVFDCLQKWLFTDVMLCPIKFMFFVCLLSFAHWSEHRVKNATHCTHAFAFDYRGQVFKCTWWSAEPLVVRIIAFAWQQKCD